MHGETKCNLSLISRQIQEGSGNETSAILVSYPDPSVARPLLDGFKRVWEQD